MSARKKFFYYCLYGWGMPILLTILKITLQYTNIVPQEYRPNIGTKTCFFDTDKRIVEFIYLYSIILAVVLANTFFFIVTAYRIIKVQRETLAVTAEANSARHSRHSYEKFRFWLYLRLFLIMGGEFNHTKKTNNNIFKNLVVDIYLTVAWSLELISWVVAPESSYFVFTDFYNCIQGILIFLLVVWNDKVKNLVIRR